MIGVFAVVTLCLRLTADATESPTATTDSPTVYLTPGPTATAAVSGDPFTTFKGVKTQFWLPMDEVVTLLVVGNVEVQGMARPYASAKGMQWITDYRVLCKQEEVLRTWAVDPEGLLPVARDKAASNPAIHTLGTSVLHGGAWKNMTVDAGRAAAGNGEVHFSYQTMNSFIGLGQKEAVSIEAEGMKIRFFSAKAPKFESDAEAIRHLHVDMVINKVDHMLAKGLLPEIWGVEPMTKTTRAMLKPPLAKFVVV